MTQKPVSVPRDNLHCSVVNRLRGHPCRVSSNVKSRAVQLLVENLETGATYERLVAVSHLRRLLAKMFENSIEKLLMEVTIDRQNNSLHVPGLNSYELETLPTEKVGKAVEHECRRTERGKSSLEDPSKRLSLAR